MRRENYKAEQWESPGGVPHHRSRQRRYSFATVFLTGFLALLLGIGLVVGAFFSVVGVNGVSLLQAMTVIESRFVGDYNWDEVTDGAMGAMVASLGDRWSYYLTPQDYLMVQETRKNAYVGIGVTISREEQNVISILSVAQGGPAEETGILPGETITAVEGTPVTQESWESCVVMIGGAEGSSVKLTVVDAQGEARSVELIRREIVSDPVIYEVLPGNVGLVRLYNFYEGSAASLMAAVDDLEAKGVDAIVFDLRNNPGGYVTELTAMLDHLLPEGTVFRSKSLDGTEENYESDQASVKLPFVVLVNGESYSAAEFFAAELHESVGAPVVGEVTSGKGYAQQLFPLPNGSAIGISTSRYYTGDGISLIGTGITPEPLVVLTEEENLLLWQGELSHENDPQLQAALEILAH